MITNFRRFSAAGILAASAVAVVALAAPAHADGEVEFLQMLNDTTRASRSSAVPLLDTLPAATGRVTR